MKPVFNKCDLYRFQLSPVVALLARKTLQMVDVGFRSHHHLEGRYHFVAGRTVARCSE